MSTEPEFGVQQNTCPDSTFCRNKVPCGPTSVSTCSSCSERNALLKYSIMGGAKSQFSGPLRIFITSNINIISFSGRKYQTNPVTYVPGDMAMWSYTHDIMKAVCLDSIGNDD